MSRYLLGLVFLLGVIPASADETRIPRLTWEPRSDWMNVRDFGAKGDGVADDTAAIQAAFDRTVETRDSYAESLRHRVVYFPAGRYRLTRTLVLAESHGAWLVGHGRDTVLVWDGPQHGIMIWNNGATYARYEGLTWDGGGKAAVGVEHKSMHYYALDVRDNQDVLVADFYSESNQRYLLATGEPGQTPGRITIGASKISTLDREAITIRNYEGRIFIGGGDGWWQSDTTQPVQIVHEGPRPVDFIIAGHMWWRTPPILNFGPGIRYASVENLLMENKYPEYNQASLPNLQPPTTQAALTAALDDFRQLGEEYLQHYFPKKP